MEAQIKEMVACCLNACLFSFLLLVCALFFYVWYLLWFSPKRVRMALLKQGITGPQPSFLYGNLNELKAAEAKNDGLAEHQCPDDMVQLLFPRLHIWRKQYGCNFAYNRANIVVLCVCEPELVRQICLYKGMELGKPSYEQKEDELLLGNSIIRANGHAWLKQRKIITPELLPGKIKGMVDVMVNSASSSLDEWGAQIDNQGGFAEIEVYEHARRTSADILCRVCFGSSYEKGEQIFSKLRALAVAINRSSLRHLPCIQLLPTKANQEIRRLSGETQSMILNVVKERRDDPSRENDLLQKIIDSANGPSPNHACFERFLVDNCRGLYLAGQQTTGTTVAWCIMLLASNPRWQEAARSEIQNVCGGKLPDVEALRHMKVVTMIIQETMRLYPVVAQLRREILSDMNINGISLPRGLIITIPIFLLHRDPNIWGEDASDFNPERFAKGVMSACAYPSTYLPFGFGPRVCPGMNFAMTEAKIILSLILSRFKFSLSYHYCHAPIDLINIIPRYGIKIIAQRV